MPSTDPQLLYFDACCFISYFADEEERADVIRALFERSLEKKIRIFTSVLSLTEVAYIPGERKKRALDPKAEQLIVNTFNDRDTVNLVEISQLIANDARAIIRSSLVASGKTVKPADAIHMASAKRVDANKLFTFDETLLRYDTLFGIEICLPHVEQAGLF